MHDLYFATIYRYVAGRLGVQTAEDIAAETFLVAFDRRKTFDAERGDLRVWLFGIATNLVARHRRKEARHYRALARLVVPAAAEGHENRVVASRPGSPKPSRTATAGPAEARSGTTRRC